MFRSISTAKAVGAHHIAPVLPCEREIVLPGGGVATEYYWKRSDQSRIYRGQHVSCTQRDGVVPNSPYSTRMTNGRIVRETYCMGHGKFVGVTTSGIVWIAWDGHPFQTVCDQFDKLNQFD